MIPSDRYLLLPCNGIAFFSSVMLFWKETMVIMGAAGEQQQMLAP